MLKHILITGTIIITACTHTEQINNSVDGKTEQKVIIAKEDKVKNALIFINGYLENSNKMNQAVGIIDWVNSNNLTTKAFKTELKKIVEEAFKQDPELGLDADPIFDAQDYPSKGFELESFDENTNYLIIRGKDLPEFKLTMKMSEENGNWLVDGCGIVNILSEQRSKR